MVNKIILSTSLVLLGLCLAAQNVSARTQQPAAVTPAQQFVNSLPENYVTTFLSYYLGVGLEQRNPKYVNPKPKDIITSILVKLFQPPKDFAENLLNFVEATFKLTDDDVYRLARDNTVCTPAGECFNPGDVGTICCPF
ncbi:uncharacterized protein LOC129724579 [Wyeomyia smithii]|uniref:uncharacterized protein LOC129724579 n=1 Tax=Wyeomyia smithii TaxID=174621 RepID=UPI002467B5BD|nr:uncharacterized protein LOC129724579 [Wyeomyia smithii]